MAEAPKRSGDVPSLPVEEILVNVAHSVVQAQQAMDIASLRSEIRIREAELDKQFGLSASWYTIPELEFDLRLAFELDSRGALKTQMVDAEYQSKYGFNLKASSLLQTRIVATPPAEGEGLSLADERTVLKRVGAIKLIVAAYARGEAPYFVVRYRPFMRQGYAGGLWYVFLMDAVSEGTRLLRALTVVDDTTGDVVRLWTDAEPGIRSLPPGDTAPGTGSADEAGAESEDTGDAITVDQWNFTPAEARAALKLVNTASAELLRDEVGLFKPARESILALRPFENLSEVGEAPGVGLAMMGRIALYVFETFNRSD